MIGIKRIKLILFLKAKTITLHKVIQVVGSNRINILLKLHGLMISKYFKTKAITLICSYISNLDIDAHAY